MTPELATLDTLSARFEAAVDRLPRSAQGSVTLAPEDTLPGQGELLREEYERLYALAPDDPQVRSALARHLFRLGSLYDLAADAGLLAQADTALSSDASETAERLAGYAQQACRHLVRSYELLPGPYAALALADRFRRARFFGTAQVWYGLAEQAAGDEGAGEEAARERQTLAAQGKTTDPPLSSGRRFPTHQTPGLMPAGLTAADSRDTGDKVGRGSAFGRYVVGGGAALLLVLVCLQGGGWLRAVRLRASASSGHPDASGSSSALSALSDRSAWRLRSSSVRRSVPDRGDGHTITYAPRNAIDGLDSTAWSPGKNMKRDGIGEWLEVDFPGVRKIARIGLIAGYPKQHPYYGDVFWLNNRVKEARLTFSDGSSVSWTLADQKPMQFLTLPAPVRTASVRLTIRRVYPSTEHRGSQARWHDTPIAEVAFWQAP